MSWSLRLKNGDLVLEGQHVAQVSGTAKLVQDLKCAILESRGHDKYHPEFGSIIDGGFNENGVYVPSVIGETDWAFVALRVESEIRRICSEYQRSQIERDKADRLRYGRSTLDLSEVLESVTNVDITQVQDTMRVRVSIRTASGKPATIDVPVAENTGVA